MKLNAFIIIAIVVTFVTTLAISAPPVFAQFGPSSQVQITNQPTVTVDDTTPIKIDFPGGVDATIQNWPATQPVSIADAIHAIIDSSASLTIGSMPAVTISGTVPVLVDDATPVNVNVVTPQPVIQRWSEVINPTVVDGSAVTVALANVPVTYTFANLSTTHPVYLVKGGAPATASDIKIMPGQALTAEDGGKIFSVYAADETEPASFQIFAVYEVSI